MHGKLRKWSASEDRLLLSSVEDCIRRNIAPDYRQIAKRIAQRSPKQCRERYENSLQPDVKRGEWSLEETICLARLMMVHGQNWAAVKDNLPSRTYNAIKKKGRKLLGEIVDRNAIPKGTKYKAPSMWPESEYEKLLNLHLDDILPHERRSDFLFLALNLKSGRSEAEVERQLIEHCACDSCSHVRNRVCVFNMSSFKEKWSLWKSGQVARSLETGDSYKFCARGRRRSSTISASSASTMATDSSKRRRLSPFAMSSPVEEMSVVEEDLFQFNFDEQEANCNYIKVETENESFGDDCFTGFHFSTPILASPVAMGGNCGEEITDGGGLKEFDLSFLLPL